MHAIDLAVEIGQFRAGADCLLHRTFGGGAVEARLVGDRYQHAQALQFLRQRSVIGFGCRMVRVQLDRGSEIGQRAAPVALLAPEFALEIEDIRKPRVEPQRRVVIADRVVDHVLALMSTAARDQRLDAVRLQRSGAVDQHAAGGDDPVGVVGGRGRDARRGIHVRIGGRPGPGGEGALERRRRQHNSNGRVADQDGRTKSHRSTRQRAFNMGESSVRQVPRKPDCGGIAFRSASGCAGPPRQFL